MNGKTYVNFLTPVPGGSETETSYVLGLTHYTCGNKKMCVNNSNGFPLASNLDVQILDTPDLIQDGVYCCNVRIVCDLTYEQIYGCNCCANTCLQTEKVVAVVCIPVVSATLPTIGGSGVIASPANVSCGCYSTNEATLNVSFTIQTTVTQNASEG